MVLSLSRWIGQVAVVTGASTGIGAAIATKLVQEGLKVAAVARRKDKLDDLATRLTGQKGKIYPIEADISKEEDILKAFKNIKENVGPVSILVNNAGVGNYGLLIDESNENTANTFLVNVIGLCTATKEAVKSMRENNIAGHIFNINSVLGHEVLNIRHTSYPASKHAVTALTETLRLEFVALGLKIKVTNISPGVVDTPMLDPIKPLLKRAYDENIILQPEDIVDCLIYALSTPPHVQVHEIMIRPVGEFVGKS